MKLTITALTAAVLAGPASAQQVLSAQSEIAFVSRQMGVPVTFTQSGTNGTATGSFSIERLDFKIGEGEWADTSRVANDVTVKFKLALSGLALQ